MEEGINFKQLWKYSNYIDLDEPMRDSMMRSEYNIYDEDIRGGFEEIEDVDLDNLDY